MSWWRKLRTHYRNTGWGSPGWTLPIPTHPRIQGNFAHWQPYVWHYCDVVQLGRGVVSMTMIRTHNDMSWAEARPVWGFDPAVPE